MALSEPSIVVGLDPREVRVDELLRRDLPGFHRPLQILDGPLDDVHDREGRGGARLSERTASRRGQRAEQSHQAGAEARGHRVSV